MIRKLTPVALVVVFALVLAVPALAGGPDFGPALFADDQVFSTKGVAALPAPNANNLQSFDKLFVIVGPQAAGQMPVAEAAPGNPAFNGGRWFTHTVSWTAEGIAAHGGTPLLTSYDAIKLHASLGHLKIEAGSPEGGPPDYFECPLLPVK